MVIHSINIDEAKYLDILNGKKDCIEMINYRDYKVNDKVWFIILTEKSFEEITPLFRITYVFYDYRKSKKYVELGLEKLC